MEWTPTKYLAVMTGSANEEERTRFLRAWREEDPDLRALITERHQRTYDLIRRLSPEMFLDEIETKPEDEPERSEETGL